VNAGAESSFSSVKYQKNGGSNKRLASQLSGSEHRLKRRVLAKPSSIRIETAAGRFFPSGVFGLKI
jgi:hypothetical protein